MPAFRSEHVIPGQPLVEMHHVARRFIKRRDRHRSFQDRFIRLLSRRNVEHEEFWPLRDVSLALRPGESLGVVGPNGAGKSTLLKLVTGILPPTSGDLVVNGRVCSLLELGAGFQPDLTGRENIYLNGSIYGLTRAEMNARVDRIVDFAELGDFIDTPVKHYSSGMYVRLGFAVAINTDPDLLLVDEVLAVGDASFQHKCLAAIQDYRATGGTLLLVSHDLNAIQSTCTHAVWLEHGMLQAEGEPIDVVMAYLAEMARKEDVARSEREGAGGVAEPVMPGRWGNGAIRITRVELWDETGATHNTFKTGSPFEVRIHFHARVPVQRPVFGLAVYHENGAHVSGPNTRFGGLEIPAVEGSGVVTYRIDELPLLEGRYRLSVAAVDAVSDEVYDYQDRLFQFHVYPDTLAERYGLVTLGGAWSLD